MLTRQRGFIPPFVIAFLVKYGVWMIAGAVIIAGVTVAVRHYNEGLREAGRNEVREEWRKEREKQAEKTAELVANARAEERANQQVIQEQKDRADAERNELAKRVATFKRDNDRLRVNRDALCKRKPSVPRPSGGGSGNTEVAGAEPVGSGAGEIDLDDVAREIGQLGADYDAALIRIRELIGVVNVCQRRGNSLSTRTEATR